MKLSQCEGDTPEEKVEDFLEQKYGEDFVVTEVDSTTTGPFGGYRHAKAYLADDPTQCTFRIWREDGGYDARFLLDMRDEVQEGKLDFKWNDMYADGTSDSCFTGKRMNLKKYIMTISTGNINDREQEEMQWKVNVQRKEAMLERRHSKKMKKRL